MVLEVERNLRYIEEITDFIQQGWPLDVVVGLICRKPVLQADIFYSQSNKAGPLLTLPSKTRNSEFPPLTP